MKKAFLVFFLILLFLSLLPNLVKADEWCDKLPPEAKKGGLVPCGRRCDDPDTKDIDESEPCTLCHFFVMIDRYIDGTLFIFVPAMAVLMIAIGGGMYILAAGKPEMISRAKSLFTAVAIGLLIIYGAWIFVNTFFMLIGINEFNEFKTLPQDWWKINCPIAHKKLPP